MLVRTGAEIVKVAARMVNAAAQTLTTSSMMTAPRTVSEMGVSAISCPLVTYQDVWAQFGDLLARGFATQEAP